MVDPVKIPLRVMVNVNAEFVVLPSSRLLLVAAIATDVSSLRISPAAMAVVIVASALALFNVTLNRSLASAIKSSLTRIEIS